MEGEDDVTQFCVEEAVFERLHWEELEQRAATSAAAATVDPMQEAKDFAAGRI